MYSFFARILEKPVCAILDECQNAYNKLSNAAPSLFSPKYPFFELKCRVKKNVKKSIKNAAKRQVRKKSQRGTMREPVALPKQKSLLRCVMDGIDFAYRYSEKPTMAVKLAKGLKYLYENAYPPLTEHKCLFTADDLSDSLIYIRKVGPNSEPLPPKLEEEDAGLHKYFPKVEQPSPKAQQEDSDLQENVAKVDQSPPAHCKHPKTDKEEADDDFILISTDYEDDDYIFLY